MVPCMSVVDAVFPYAMAVALAAVVGILFAGVATMSRGGAFNDKWGNKLMRARVISQGIAVTLLLIFFLLHRS